MTERGANAYLVYNYPALKQSKAFRSKLGAENPRILLEMATFLEER